MRRYLPWILLAVSVALNVFFVGGHVYARRMAESQVEPEAAGPAHPAFARLGLTPEQRENLMKLRGKARERTKANRPIDRELGLALLDELMKPSRDAQAVDALLRQLAERRAAHVRPAIEELAGFLATLSPEQRARVREVAELRGPMFLVQPLVGRHGGKPPG